MLFATVRIETSSSDGGGAGTGFIFNYAHSSETSRVPFLVTNKHVVSQSTHGHLIFTVGNGNNEPLVGKQYDLLLDNFEGRWHGHPNPEVDVTVMPLAPIVKAINTSIFYTQIPLDLIPTSTQVEELDTIEEVLFVGYPNGIMDDKNLLPIVRKGITATPFRFDYQGKPQFLIDASVFPGSSGSPVFICNQGGYNHRGNMVVGNRILFLGIVAEVIIENDEGQIEFVPTPTKQIPIVRTQQMIDLGVVFKSSTVAEAIADFFKVTKA